MKWIATKGFEPGIITYYVRQTAKDRGITEEELREETRQQNEREDRRWE